MENFVSREEILSASSGFIAECSFTANVPKSLVKESFKVKVKTVLKR